MTPDVKRRWIRRPQPREVAPWLVVAALIAVGSLSLQPPAPLPTNAHPERFSALRAMEHVRVIAREPHPMGTPAIAKVRDYIVAELEKLDIDVDLQAFTAPDFYGRGEPVPVINILARIPGTASTKAVALMGHYDTVPATPGANDNTAAVATLLETARALRAGPPARNDIALFFTDGEEPAPRHGANAIVRARPIVDELGLVVNLEASGGSGASVLAETSGPERWLIDELAAADARPAAFSFLTQTSRLMGDIGTDFDCFRNAGVPGLHFVYLHGSPIYHTAADNISSVSRASLQHHGEHTLSIVRHFGELDLAAPGPADRMVFFVVGPYCIRYSSRWAVPLAVLAAVLLLIGWWRRRGLPGSPAAHLPLRLLRTLAGGLLATIAGVLAWMLIASLRSTPGAVEGYAYLAFIFLLAMWLATWIARPRSGERELLVPWLWGVFSLLTAVWLPGFSYLFVWPLLAVAIVLLWKATGGWWIRFVIVALPTVVLMIPPIALFFQFAQPRPGNTDSEMPMAVALPLLLALLSAGLLWTTRPQRTEPGTQSPE